MLFAKAFFGVSSKFQFLAFSQFHDQYFCRETKKLSLPKKTKVWQRFFAEPEVQLPSVSPYSLASSSLCLEVTGNTLGSLDFRSAVVTCLVWSSEHLTSRVNSTLHSGQKSGQLQSLVYWILSTTCKKIRITVDDRIFLFLPSPEVLWRHFYRFFSAIYWIHWAIGCLGNWRKKREFCFVLKQQSFQKCISGQSDLKSFLNRVPVNMNFLLFFCRDIFCRKLSIFFSPKFFLWRKQKIQCTNIHCHSMPNNPWQKIGRVKTT